MDSKTDNIKYYRTKIADIFENRGGGDYFDVIRLTNKLSKLGDEKDKIWALEQKADAYYRMNEYKKALPLYHKLISLYLKGKIDFPNYYYRAQIYLSNQKYEKAYSDFTSAIKYNENFNLYIYRAKASIGLKNYHAAKSDLQKASELMINLQPSYKELKQDEINSLLHQINKKQHPQRNNQTKKTGLKKLIDFGKRLIGK